jgi:hypothetical protein
MNRVLVAWILVILVIFAVVGTAVVLASASPSPLPVCSNGCRPIMDDEPVLGCSDVDSQGRRVNANLPGCSGQ